MTNENKIKVNEFYGIFTLSSQYSIDFECMIPIILDIERTIFESKGGIEIWSTR
jgi:hypothetical protein